MAKKDIEGLEGVDLTDFAKVIGNTLPAALAGASEEEIAATQGALGVTGGKLLDGAWIKLPAIYRLDVGGAGTITIDSRARDGTVTTGVATYNPNGPAEDYPYFDNAYEVRATLTGTATAEIV